MSFFSIEPLLQRRRIERILPYITFGGVLVDVGCDTSHYLIDMVKDKMKYCVGIDSEIDNSKCGTVEYKKVFIKRKIPVESEFADVVTMLAVLEHLDDSRAIAMELCRILKPGGTLLLTVPSPRNKLLLEFLAFFRIVRPEMIAQHKHYFTAKELIELFYEVGFSQVDVRMFQLGLNTFMKATK